VTAARARVLRLGSIVQDRSSVYLELMKPRITLMVMLMVALGYELAAAGAGSSRLVHVLIGAGLSCSGAGALNQFLERSPDRAMARTRFRPLPSRRVSPSTVLVSGMLLASVGVSYLLVTTNSLTAAVDAFILASYLLVYTPLKRRTSLATLVGAVPGALPPVMGWAAARGQIEAPAMILFAILFLWQVPHFLAIGWMYREDYARAGFPMLAVVDADGAATGRQMVLYSLALIPVSLMIVPLQLADALYAVLATLAGSGYVLACVRANRRRTRTAARAVLLASVLYLPALSAALLIDRLLI